MDYIIPAVIVLIVLSGIKAKIPVYNTFLEGVADGMKTVLNIFPIILSVSVCVEMLKASGTLALFEKIIYPVTDLLHIPSEALPLVLVRPISGGGALSVLTDILKNHSPDMPIGFFASVIMGSSETTFYTLTVYFKNTRAKYTKYVIPAAVFGDIVGVLVGAALGTIIF